MTSLNNFKMADRQVDEPVIPPNLDTMLGNLQVILENYSTKNLPWKFLEFSVNFCLEKKITQYYE